MRRPIAALAALALSLALAAPASATQAEEQPVFTYTATIDCGSGAVTVGSTDDLYAPLVDLSSGREYQPVAWSVQVGDSLFEDMLQGASLKRTVKCSYDDGVATGFVTVKRSHGADREKHRGDGHHRQHGGHDDDWDHSDRD